MRMIGARAPRVKIERNTTGLSQRPLRRLSGRRSRALRLASGLHRLGLKPQERFAVLAMNCLEYYEAYAAAMLQIMGSRFELGRQLCTIKSVSRQGTSNTLTEECQETVTGRKSAGKLTVVALPTWLFHAELMRARKSVNA